MLFRKKLFCLFQILSNKRWDVAQKLLAAFPKLKIAYPGDQILSHFLMFDDPFCQFPTFLAEVLWKVCRNGLLWALRIVLKEKIFSNEEVFFKIISDLEQKKFKVPANKISRDAKILIN